MIVTVLEARVAEERARDLLDAYRGRTGSLPPGMVETYLLRDRDDRERWRIFTVWSGWEAVEAMRATTPTPGGVLIFRAAGVEPVLTVLEVAEHAPAEAS